jgi:hypothetical protein
VSTIKGLQQMHVLSSDLPRPACLPGPHPPQAPRNLGNSEVFKTNHRRIGRSTMKVSS